MLISRTGILLATISSIGKKTYLTAQRDMCHQWGFSLYDLYTDLQGMVMNSSTETRDERENGKCRLSIFVLVFFSYFEARQKKK